MFSSAVSSRRKSKRSGCGWGVQSLLKGFWVVWPKGIQDFCHRLRQDDASGICTAPKYAGDDARDGLGGTGEFCAHILIKKVHVCRDRGGRKFC